MNFLTLVNNLIKMAIHKSGLTVTEVDIPNGDADSYTLSSKTIVKSGVPYLVQMNPAAADEEGPPVFDIQVIGKYQFRFSYQVHAETVREMSIGL